MDHHDTHHTGGKSPQGEGRRTGGKPKGKYEGKRTGSTGRNLKGNTPGNRTGSTGRRPHGKDDKITALKQNVTREEIRLNKYIAAAGICSRREADRLISSGLISVNGKVVTELGTKVGPGHDVRYNGVRIRNEKKVYLLLNKPKDYVTTTRDPKERKTVMSLVKNACPERIYPVGRLDRNTTGVLLFTNDGEMAKKLTHPSYNKKKIYHVFLDKPLYQRDLRTLAGGIELDDGFIQPDAISYVQNDNKLEVGLEIHSGRNRIVRRMFESLGYRVTKLDRVYFAGLTKKNLPKGKWRFLTDKEIQRLQMNAYE